jgi:hypothetical protein
MSSLEFQRELSAGGGGGGADPAAIAALEA